MRPPFALLSGASFSMAAGAALAALPDVVGLCVALPLGIVAAAMFGLHDREIARRAFDAGCNCADRVQLADLCRSPGHEA